MTVARLPGPQAAALITAALPVDQQLPATWPVFAALLPHTLAALPLTSGPVHQVAPDGKGHAI